MRRMDDILAVVSVFVALLLVTPAAHAGPPLICWPFDTGGARSLPWSGGGWHDAQPDYDLNQLPTDTLALLTPDVAVLARMETLRRAAIYAGKDRGAAKKLLLALQDRAQAGHSAGRQDPLALFDVGYFIESYRQGANAPRSWASKELLSEPEPRLNGYELVERALALRNTDPEMEFAAALVALAVHQPLAAHQHLAGAAAGATEGSLLARNLLAHSHLFEVHAATLAELRGQLATPKD